MKRSIKQLVFWSALLFSAGVLYGCGGGGGGGNGAVDQKTSPKISTSSAVPGQVIRISDGSIHADDIVDVVFQIPAAKSGSDASITVKGVAPEDGYVDVAAPPYIDAAEGAFKSGRVVISVNGRAADMELMIEEQLKLDAETKGIITVAFFESAVEKYKKSLSNLSVMQDDFGGQMDGVDDLMAAIQDEVDRLEAQIQEIEQKGSLTLGEDLLTGDDLNVLDRMNLSTFVSLSVINNGGDDVIQETPSDNDDTDTDGDGDGGDDGGWDDGDGTEIEIIPVGLAARGTNSYLKSHWRQANEAMNKANTNKKIKESAKGFSENAIKDAIQAAKDWYPTVFGYISLLCSGAARIDSLKHAANAQGIMNAQYSTAYSIAQAEFLQENTDAMNSGDDGKFSRSGELLSSMARLGSQYASAASDALGGMLGGMVNVGLAVKDMLPSLKKSLCGKLGRFCSDDSGTSGSDSDTSLIKVQWFHNFNNSEGANMKAADIQVSGSTKKLTISWPGSATALYVIAADPLSGADSILYGLSGKSDGSGSFLSPVVYGDYSTSGLEALGDDPAPGLATNVMYNIQIVNKNNAQAMLIFSLTK